MRISPRLCLLASLLALSCGTAQPNAPAQVAAPPSAASSPPAASSAVVVAEAPPAPTTAPSEPPPPPDPPAVDLGRFVLSLEQPITSLALGEPRVAALGADPWLFEGGVWKKIPFTERLRPRDGERDDGRIFFGRDDRPRIMGTRHRPDGPTQLYMRWRNAKWNEERGEIAKLREPPPQGMWGVLGHADPEVVCKVSSDCIIKRRTGWKMMPAGTSSPRVELHNGMAWALGESSVARLRDDHEWATLTPPETIHSPGGVWGTADEAWISEPGANRLLHVQNGKWTTEPSPIPEPRGMWGASSNDVWLTGKTGLAHYDGVRWSRVTGPTGALVEVYGRGTEIWAAGPSGVWFRATGK